MSFLIHYQQMDPISESLSPLASVCIPQGQPLHRQSPVISSLRLCPCCQAHTVGNHSSPRDQGIQKTFLAAQGQKIPQRRQATECTRRTNPGLCQSSHIHFPRTGSGFYEQCKHGEFTYLLTGFQVSYI